MSAEPGPPVGSDQYDERYYAEDCGGAEFYRLYGPKILKPPLAYSLKRAGLEPGMRILDIGCGRGELLHHARLAGASGVGTDYSAAALGLAASTSGCPVVRCDAKQLPFADASFDRVFLIGVVDHLHPWELELCFSEIARVLKEGGLAIVHTCTNLLYYKNWTYGARRAAARALAAVGVKVADPRPPRSETDCSVHVNEHSAARLARFFEKIGWEAEVEARPNYKLVVRELYGDDRPGDFPLEAAPPWKVSLYKVLFRWPLTVFLARELFAVARPLRRRQA